MTVANGGLVGALYIIHVPTFLFNQSTDVSDGSFCAVLDFANIPFQYPFNLP